MLGNSKGVIKDIKGLEKFEDTLTYISDERIFSLSNYDDNYYIRENCDDYFSVELTPEICKDLSKVFKVLGKHIKKGEKEMKVEVIKAEEIKVEYEVGDVISLGNPYQLKNYLLINSNGTNFIGAINLGTNDLEYYYKAERGLDTVVKDIVEDNEWNEWALIKSDDVKLTLDCKNGAIQQRNQSSPEFSSKETILHAGTL